MTTATASTSSPRVQPTVGGLHHVTAITADAQRNIDFYTGALGLRLVKVTVNYDDPSSYHLYYGDGLGRPGTVMTFFAWPHGRPGRTGVGQVSETALGIPVGGRNYWQQRLAGAGATEIEQSSRFDSPILTFRDPDGLALSLVETPDLADLHRWHHSEVPAEWAIRGFHSVALLENDNADPAAILVDRFGYHQAAIDGARVRYVLGQTGVARTVDVVVTDAQTLPATGAGQVHHVAFRTPDDEQQQHWLELLLKEGRRVSPVMNRDYFHSIYFREPGGVLFEIATEGPGFTLNEPAEALGTHLMLPQGLESQRSAIEASVPAIRFPGPMGP